MIFFNSNDRKLICIFLQIQKLSHSFTTPYELDTLLSGITVTGSYIYAVFGILASITSIPDYESIVVFAQCVLLLIQVSFQGTIIFFVTCLVFRIYKAAI